MRRLRLTHLLILLCVIAGSGSATEYIHRFSPEDKTQITGVATDEEGNIYVCGSTLNRAAIPGATVLGSGNPSGSAADGFVMKFAADEHVVAATVFGGGKADEALRIAVDPSGNVVVCGRTVSADFPTKNALQQGLAGKSDVFICKFDSSCTNLVFSTLCGGSEGEYATAMAVDGLGDIVVAGMTDSDGFPAGEVSRPSGEFSRLSQPFVVKLAGNCASLRYAFRFGGSGSQQISSVAADAEGNAFLTGGTSSYDFPTLNALQDSRPLFNQQSAFVAKLAPNGALVFSTYLAGDGYDQAEAVTVNNLGEIFVAGWTGSEVFPDLSAPFLSVPGESRYRAFLLKLDPQGSVVPSTNFYGSSQFDRFASLGVSLDGVAFAAGTVQAYRGLPMITELRKDGSTSTFVDRLGCGEGWAGVTGMAVDGTGSVILTGEEGVSGSASAGFYVARFGPATMPRLSEPKVRIISPAAGTKATPNQPLYLNAAVLGATGKVTSVKFYVGKRLIGSATNAPFAVYWAKPSRGVYNLKAVASVDGRTVPSCVVRLAVTSPKNDNFARRIRLRGETVDALVDTTGSTLEPGEEQLSFALGSVWYSWTAPRDGLFSIDAGAAGGGDYRFEVYTGTQLRNLQILDDAALPGERTITVQRGVTYQIRVERYLASTPGNLRIQPVTPPPNDNFANATTLVGDAASIVATTRHATSEPGEFPWDPYDHREATIWYSWSAPAAGLYLVALEGERRLPALSIYSGNAISNLTAVGQLVWGATNGVAFQAQAGAKYFISLRNGDTNSCLLRITPYAAPANDNFADRFTIPPGTNSVMGTLIGATSEPGEPSNWYSPEPSVWWSWRPETSGVYWIDVIEILPVSSSGARYSVGRSSQVVRAFTGDNVTMLTPVTSGSGNSPLMLHASSETTYHLVVAGDMALFALNIWSVSSPTNDDFDTAVVLGGPAAIKAGTTVGATIEPGESSHETSSSLYHGDDSVWYRWTAPSNGVYAISALEARTMDIYEGISLTQLTLVASNANSYVLQLVGGVEYRLAVVGGNSFRLVIRPGSRPENDDFLNAKLIAGLQTGFGGTITDATAEDGEPAHNGSPARKSIWFAWMAPTNGSFLVRFTNSLSGTIAVYTGFPLERLVRVGVDGGYAGYEFLAVAGVNYRIAVQLSDWYRDYHPQEVSLELRYCPPPRNDDFAGRIRLTGLEPGVTASNVGAALQSGEPRHGAAGLGHTVWWTWRAPLDGRVSFAVESTGSGSYFNGVLGVYSGTSVGALTPLFSTNTSASVLNLRVQKGRDYQISVDNASGLTGQYRLGLHYTPIPTNDSFANRRSFTNDATGTLQGASREAGEPGYELDPYGASAWWKWTAPSTGLYEFNLGPYGPANGIEVFRGETLEALVPVDGEPSYMTTYRRFQATAGTAYVVQISGLSTDGQYSLHTSFTPSPVNDNFADRILLVGTNLVVDGSDLAATAEWNEPTHDGAPAKRSVWWTWNAPANGMVKIGMVSYASRRIAVYSGNELDKLESVNLGYGALVFRVEAGQSFQFVFDQDRFYDNYPFPGGIGPFVWSLTFHSPPPNDAFENRLAVTGEPPSAYGTALGASLEAGEPMLPFSPGNSVWWKWVAPETGRYTFSVSDSSAPPFLAVYSGTELTNLTRLASSAWGFYSVNLHIEVGTEVAISVDPDLSLGGYNTSFVLTILRTQAPANDDFANRALLDDAIGVEGNLEGSSREPGEPGFQNNPGGTSIWWRYTPARTGWYSFAATFPPYGYLRASVLVFSGSNVTNLSAAPKRGYFPTTAFQLEGGKEYSVQVSGQDGWFGPLMLSLEPLEAPSNDQFADAQAILSDDAILTGSNLTASVEAGEPARQYGGDSIWWKWTAVSNGVFAITRSNSAVYAYVDVYTGASVSNLTQVPNTIYGREGGEYLFRATSGTTYYISVVAGGYGGPVQLAFDRVNPPLNDDIANRITLSGSHLSIVASNFNATAEPGDPLAAAYSQQTVWWKWTAPASGLVALNAQSDDYIPFEIGVFRGNPVEGLDWVDIWWLPAAFYATEGEEYVIGVTTRFSPAAQFTLSLNAPEPLRSPSGPVSVPLPQVNEITGTPLTVETSTNLVDWVPFSALAPGEKEFRVVPNPAEPQRFFRVR